LLQEEARAYRTRASALRDIHLVAGPTPDPSVLTRLRRCLAALPASRRELLERCYTGERAQLAPRDRGISLNALRNRVLRLRRQLFDSVKREA
jgi:DNA-directed RNA polymerase specialized sigma24 family protein